MIIESIEKKNDRIDNKLIIYFLYIIYLIFVLSTNWNIWLMLYAHITITILFSLYYFGRDFLYILISPLWIIVFPVQLYLIREHLKKYDQNIPRKTVIVLASSDWHRLKSWVIPNYFNSEIKVLTNYLEKKGDKFSFYTNATILNVHEIMGNKDIREVYFYGHGTSHVFQLSNNEILYYCDFSDYDKYNKDYIYQVHCGTPDGKSLVDYVVPEKNRDKCFLFRKTINAIEIEKEFRKRTNEIPQKSITV